MHLSKNNFSNIPAVRAGDRGARGLFDILKGLPVADRGGHTFQLKMIHID